MFVLAAAIVLGVAALIGGASARSLIEDATSTQAPTSSSTTAANGAELDPITPSTAVSEAETESDRAARMLDIVVISLVLLGLIVAGVTVVIWRRSRPSVGSDPPDPAHDPPQVMSDHV